MPHSIKRRGDLVHRYYQNQVQIDGGKNDKFAIAVSDAKGLAMGVYDTANLPLAALARRYTLADDFFQGAFGGSFLNHQWLIRRAHAPRSPSAAEGRRLVRHPRVLDAQTARRWRATDLPLTTVRTATGR